MALASSPGALPPPHIAPPSHGATIVPMGSTGEGRKEGGGIKGEVRKLGTAGRKGGRGYRGRRDGQMYICFMLPSVIDVIHFLCGLYTHRPVYVCYRVFTYTW